MIMRNVTIATAMLVLTQSSGDPGRPVGVLVGLHHRDTSGDLPGNGGQDSEPPSAGQLRTVWVPVVNPSSGESIEAFELPDLLLPRRSGFWRAGLLGTCAERTQTNVDGDALGTETEIADYLWVTPVGRRPQVRLEPRYSSDPAERVAPCVARDTYCDIDRRTRIFWIWPEYMSLDLGRSASCGAHPDWSPGYTVRSAGDLARPVSIRGALGVAAEQRFLRALESAKQTYTSNPECAEPAKFEPDSWHIERQPGRWKAEGWSNTYRLCGYGVDFTVDLDLSAVTGRQDDRSGWPMLKATMPQLTDAHFGPGGRWVLATTETDLLLFADVASDRPAIRVPISTGDTVIMVEWATGPNVARWTAEVRRAREGSRPEPVVLRPPSAR